MASVNRVTILGNLCADPELKYLPSGKNVCNLRVATNEVFKDASGQKKEKAEFHRVTVYGGQAENCHKYLTKGSGVYVEGRLETRQWDDKDGKRQYSTEIVASHVQFLASRSPMDQREPKRVQEQSMNQLPPCDVDDDLGF